MEVAVAKSKKKRQTVPYRMEHERGTLPSSWEQRQWKRGRPFFQNPRGLLTHRVRSVKTHLRDGKISHYSCDYLCGNGGRFDSRDDLLIEPPEGRMVCQLCEFTAKRQGKPSADELVGRHVHVGKLRVEQVCCHPNKN